MDNLNRRENPATVTPKGTNVTKACANCQQRKAKCDSNRPCWSCTGASLECRESEKPDRRSRRKGVVDVDTEGSKVHALERRVGKLENTVAELGMQIAHLSSRIPPSPAAMPGTSTCAPPPSILTTPSFGDLGTPEASSFFGVTEGSSAYPFSPTTHLRPGIHIPSSSPGSNEYSSLQNDLIPSDPRIDHRPDPNFLNRPVASAIVQPPLMSTAQWTSYTGSTAFATAATSPTTAASMIFASPVHPLPDRGNTAGKPTSLPVVNLASNAVSRDQRAEKPRDSPYFWGSKPPH
ncbi:hypothetical protein EXIGLDRAFT_841917 [Exidia glandulosa HHB12029]|uniref:Zn(2)-C6 fungal-type domain-containing protein n=1 Tax=Exidia glandulosa HHB12029 TaxID=1314781 RepID=A0A165DKY6_EXIGL|nr:hypothetical protein EXIGLDRAFT_841917 [Exidia glandulosa HHB12029]